MRATAVALILLVANLFGYGFGPPIIGAISDHLTKFLAAASPASQHLCEAAAWLRPACEAPSAGGLQWTLALLALANFWAFYHFVMISRHYKPSEPGPPWSSSKGFQVAMSMERPPQPYSMRNPSGERG